MLDKIELVDCVVAEAEVVLVVLVAEVGEEEEEVLVGVAGGVGVDNVVGGVVAGVERPPEMVGAEGVIVRGLDII